MARDNICWGYAKINGIVPAQVRLGFIGWRQLKNHYKEKLLACDFYTVEAIFLRTIYELIFIELDTRRVHLAGVTSDPDGLWILRKFDNSFGNSTNRKQAFAASFGIITRSTRNLLVLVFEPSSIRIIPKPIRAPNAIAFTERWVRRVRQECPDPSLIGE